MHSGTEFNELMAVLYAWTDAPTYNLWFKINLFDELNKILGWSWKEEQTQFGSTHTHARRLLSGYWILHTVILSCNVCTNG